MSKLILVTGQQGSGKTRYARKRATSNDFILDEVTSIEDFNIKLKECKIHAENYFLCSEEPASQFPELKFDEVIHLPIKI